MLYDEADRVVGVRTGDKGLDREGKPRPNFEPGVDIKAKVTVLGEGPRGSLVKQLTQRLNLNDGREPQVYSLGIKELWELPDDRYPAGRVTHTLGYPSDAHTYGGGWIYGMQNRIVNIGYVTGLDYSDPLLDPHAEFQRYKEHPFVAKLLEGGRMIRYGAKTIAAGGFYAIPQFHGDGFLIAGDSAGFLNSQRLKGIHTAIKSGMLAAQTIFEALLVGDFSKPQHRRYKQLVRESWITGELKRVRNFHAAFRHGRWLGLANAGLQFLTGGRSWGIFDRAAAEPGHEAMKKLSEFGYRGADIEQRTASCALKQLTFNKVTDVYHARSRMTKTSRSPSCPRYGHLRDALRRRVWNPCQRFCPAAVYEMVEDAGSNGKRRLQINFSNCVHCKTCDIMDPTRSQRVTPEAAAGRL